MISTPTAVSTNAIKSSLSSTLLKPIKSYELKGFDDINKMIEDSKKMNDDDNITFR